MKTYFAPAPRSEKRELDEQIQAAMRNPVINGLLKTVGGLLAVLNEQRQILAVNDAMLEMLGIEDAGSVLGLRPGEAVRCVHAREMEGGCGTGRFCSSCGAAIAIVVSLGSRRVEERECSIVVEKNGKMLDHYLRVRSCPFAANGRRFVLLFLQDITAHQRRAALERAFFHDVNNIIASLQIESQLLGLPDKPHIFEVAAHIQHLVKLLDREVKIQRAIVAADLSDYPLTLESIPVADIFKEITVSFANHPAARGRSLRLPDSLPDLELKTDFLLLLRILSNMLVNALEATPDGGEVRVWLEQGRGTVAFCVWNSQFIPDDTARRVFERNFTTKMEPGRGVGTFAMKLFAESSLGARVDFTTSEKEGTVFRLAFPA